MNKFDAAMAISHADQASIQKFFPERGANGNLSSWVIAGSPKKQPR
jgi:hypothetical protein